MLTKKQEKAIRARAQEIKATIQIGKNEMSDELVKTIDSALEANEIVKISLLANTFVSKEEVLALCEEKLEALYAFSIGNKIVAFRPSTNKKKQILSNEIFSIK